MCSKPSGMPRLAAFSRTGAMAPSRRVAAASHVRVPPRPAVISTHSASRVAADVAVDDGVVTAVGADVGEGVDAIDARGCVVTPGFVDPHTHLDVQLFWDPAATPSCLHGVTTVVLSSCGFGVAPCPPGGKDYMLRSLEFVEEIPFAATSVAVPFGWTSWSEYADALSELPLG